MQAGGSTAGGEGLALAYAMAEQNFDKDAVNRVILMTDGDFNVGIADPEKLEDFVAEKRKTGVYLSVYGFGRGNYNDVMMQTLSQIGQRHRRLYRHAAGGAQAVPRRLLRLALPDRRRRQDPGRVQSRPRRRVPADRLRDPACSTARTSTTTRSTPARSAPGASVTALYEITPVGGPLSVDPLRYGDAPKTAHDGPDGELAFVKVRYKLPGEATSKLIERPIGDADRPAALAEAPEATRWALAVAAYGQKLRGDPWLAPSFGWDAIGALAQGARGDDPFGLRAEFVQLVRAAETAKSVNE